MFAADWTRGHLGVVDVALFWPQKRCSVQKEEIWYNGWQVLCGGSILRIWIFRWFVILLLAFSPCVCVVLNFSSSICSSLFQVFSAACFNQQLLPQRSLCLYRALPYSDKYVALMLRENGPVYQTECLVKTESERNISNCSKNSRLCWDNESAKGILYLIVIHTNVNTKSEFEKTQTASTGATMQTNE